MRRELIQYAWSNIMHRKMRSFLTVLSILIGIAAIFALMSFGQGLSGYIEESFAETGLDKLMVQPKGFAPPGHSGTLFTDDDIDGIRHVVGVREVAPWLFRAAEVKQSEHDKPRIVYVIGMSTEREQQRLLEEQLTVDILQGRKLQKGDDSKAVLGYNYQFDNKVFKKGVKLRDKIIINSEHFKVIGFYEQVGNSEDDKNIYLTQDAAEELFGVKGAYEYLSVRVEPGFDPAAIVPKVEKALRKSRDVDEGKEDFFVQTYEELLEVFGTIVGVLNGVLILIALISVVVSAINIANTMYTAVLERTKEIGIMKAIGSKNNAVLFIFLIESGMLGIIGGAIGVAVGAVISSAAGNIAAAAGWPILQPLFPWWLIAGCLMFAFIVGMASGALPAIQAARQKPVDALRYE